MNKITIVQLLINTGASVNIRTIEGYTALDFGILNSIDISTS